MLTQLVSVEPEPRLIIRRPKIKKRPHMRTLLIRKISLIPHWPFVEQERLALRVPVPRDAQLKRAIKVVLNQIAFRFWLRVFEIAGPDASFVRINNGVPHAVKAERRPRANVCNKNGRTALRERVS